MSSSPIIATNHVHTVHLAVTLFPSWHRDTYPNPYRRIPRLGLKSFAIGEVAIEGFVVQELATGCVLIGEVVVGVLITDKLAVGKVFIGSVVVR
jgi:hypothetical protein